MYIYPKLITWDWTTFVGSHPWRPLAPFSQPPLVTCSCSFRGSTCGITPIHTDMSTGIVIMPFLFRQPYCREFIGALSLPFLGGVLLSSSHPGHLALNRSIPPLGWSLSPRSYFALKTYQLGSGASWTVNLCILTGCGLKHN